MKGRGNWELGIIAHENGLNPNMLRGWKWEFLDKASTVFEDPAKVEKEAKRDERRLKKESDQMLKPIGQLTLERDFLQGCFRQFGLPEPELGSENEALSVHRQCELLGITRSTVYYEAKQPDEKALRLKEEIMSRIDYWHTALPCMGTRKLAVKLHTEGCTVGRKLVRAYMQEMGIHAVYPNPNLSKCNSKESIVPYSLRNKVILFQNQAWSIDITYIKMQHGHMYLTAIIDWFSRKIMGWEMSDTLETAPVLDAVRTAVEPCVDKQDAGKTARLNC